MLAMKIIYSVVALLSAAFGVFATYKIITIAQLALTTGHTDREYAYIPFAMETAIVVYLAAIWLAVLLLAIRSRA